MHIKSFASLAVFAAALICLPTSRAASATPPLFNGKLDKSFWNGKNLNGWRMVSTDPSAKKNALWKVHDGVISTPGKPKGYLVTKRTYKNFQLHVEWRWPAKPENNGILVDLVGPDHVWPKCIQVQLKDQHAGDYITMGGADFHQRPRTAPIEYYKPHIKPSSEKPAGEWNSCDIVYKDGVIDVYINGVLQNHVTGATPDSGAIGIQMEGYPIQFRNLKLQKLR